MNVVDSSAWLEYFAGGKNADFFASAIEDAHNLLVPTVCLLEVFKVQLRQRGESAAQVSVAGMQLGRVIGLDEEIAERAARLGVAHKLPLADSIVYATALAHGADVWTQDTDFDGLPSVHFRAKQ